MSVEVFIYSKEAAPRRSLPELQAELAAAGVRCQIEHLDDGPWLVLEGHETDMSITVDADGTATSAMVQCMDSPDVLDRLFQAFERLQWAVTGEDQ